MTHHRRSFGLLAMAAVVLLARTPTAQAYIGGPPLCLGIMCNWSTHAVIVQVERVDREKNTVVFRKLRDLKGRWPADVMVHAIGAGAPDRTYVMQWAEPGKTTVMFALESYRWGHVYIDGQWYATNTADWRAWNYSHSEPMLLRGFSGRTERLISASTSIYAGREVVVPGLVDGPVADLASRRAKVQRLKASLKLLDYNPKRDFFGMGGDDFMPLAGMPGFSQQAPLPRVGPDALAISALDIDGDAKLDLCLIGASSTAMLRNDGEAFSQFGFNFPGLVPGCRSALWADYNGDGRPDLLLATANGPKLYANLAAGFRDDTALLPRELCYNLTAAAWIDFDGDGLSDILLGNGFHGLRLYRNKGKADMVGVPPATKGQPPAVATWFDDVSTRIGLGQEGIGGSTKGDTLTVSDVDGDGRPDFLYGAGTGILAMNTPTGFVEARDSGIVYKPGKVGPLFGDFDGDGHSDLLVPQDGACKLFRNDGKGKFVDMTAQSGDLAKPAGNAVCAAWGDLDNDGRPDLMVGCVRGHNRFYRNLGGGKFTDATEELGLHKKTYNTQAICLIDLNNDGVLDAVFNNEGQDSCVLLGDPSMRGMKTAVSLHVGGAGGVLGSKLRILDSAGKPVASHFVGGTEGRGGQGPSLARFALEPGTYKAEVRYSSGKQQTKEFTVAEAPLSVKLDGVAK